MHDPQVDLKESNSGWPRLLLWLTVAALADWLITRTLTRAGIFMPKAPAVSTLFQGVGVVGQLVFTTSALLAMGLIGWFAWREFKHGKKVLPAAIAVLIGLMLFNLVVAPSGSIAIVYHLIAIVAILAITREGWIMDSNWRRRIALSFPAAALLVGEFYLVVSALELAIRDTGTPINGGLFFNLGELLFVAAGFALWWFYGRGRIGVAARILPLLAALAFSALYLAQPAMTGIISIWSSGLTLYLPWPVYAVSLYAALTAVMVQLHARRPEGLGILLFMAAGFVPQLSHQFLMGLIGLAVICIPMGYRFTPDPAMKISPAYRHAPP